ncbi:class I SAM-dependent methyltransferase [Amnibacterium flavum]|uniref:Demethylmenaquinone methyltransferase n=1 Tax=Amnibacterium flavum TaxID=2173173 RepID=A0A2V1HY55_9MICO|nr:bifunctional demethylmenaquinone methyltransferase/2-methoxy-6-polyprenyl-1,4-benzoquinol methylase [Amnibacterium flavum]
MFDQVSSRYDRTNAILSVGNDSLWRAATTRAVAPKPGERILDLAAGTGTSSAALAASGAHVVAADFSDGMLEVGRRRHAGNPLLEFVHADALDLPFADDEFDAVTISFGLRNVEDPHRALAELFRVTAPGGRIVVCEFSTPTSAFLRAGHRVYLRTAMPLLSKFSSSNAPAYDYLGDSILEWADQPTLAEWIREAGYEQVAYRNLTAGVVALHRGHKAARVA